MLRATSQQQSECGLKFTYRRGETADAPLVFLVHGRAGNDEVMWAFRRTIPENFAIIAPEAPLNDPYDGGKSWWLIHDENSDQQQKAAVKSLQQFFIRAPGVLGLNPQTTLLAGFSQGGAMASHMVSHMKNHFAGLAMLASFIPEQAARTFSEMKEPPVPEVLVLHGSDDETIPVAWAERAAEIYETLGADVLFVADEVGHKVGREGMKALKEWFHSY